MQCIVVTYARDSNKEKTCVCSSKFQFRPKVMFYIISRAFVSCLGCQHFISDWLGKLKPNKLSTRCQNELKGAAVEKATNPARRFLFFLWLRCSSAWLDKTAMLRRLKFSQNWLPLESGPCQERFYNLSLFSLYVHLGENCPSKKTF